jgi:hypothetical protein
LWQKQVIHFLKTKPAFLLLLPLSYVLHEFTRNFYAVPAGGALSLVLIYFTIAYLTSVLCRLIFRSKLKAYLFAFAFLAYQLFFGAVQDVLKNIPVSFFSQYRFILPASLLFFILIGYWLSKKEELLQHITIYLNVLLLVLTAIDTAWLIKKINGDKNYVAINKTMAGQIIPDSCNKPDIYLLLMDQYAGSSTLVKTFNFDNSPFLDELKKRGFYVAKKSHSNYNLTPFSMASALSMNYLDPEMAVKTKLNLSYCYQAIRNSSVIKFLTGNGYKFYNYSIFDFPGQPAHKYEAFLPYGIDLITLNTFTGRINRDIRSGIAEGRFGSGPLRKKIVYENFFYNDSTFKQTRNIVLKKETTPKFVYSHFMLPHFPYYFDKAGNPLPIDKLTDFKRTNSNDYIGYLQFGNKQILELVDAILKNSTSPPVIMLLSDHGSRRINKDEENSNDFVNLNAVYIPGGNYTQFYDSITNVNQFRVLFNSCFDQRLPLLKDSTSDIKN